MKRILVAGMGNVLRGDDGFGIRVVERLMAMHLPPGVEVYEAGGAGIALAQKLMDGFDACIIVDAALRGFAPGTLSCIEPEICVQPRSIGLHEQDPSKVLALAAALGALPARVLLVGCEPLEVDELLADLSSPVAAAVEPAVHRILLELKQLASAVPPQPLPASQ